MDVYKAGGNLIGPLNICARAKAGSLYSSFGRQAFLFQRGRDSQYIRKTDSWS